MLTYHSKILADRVQWGRNASTFRLINTNNKMVGKLDKKPDPKRCTN